MRRAGLLALRAGPLALWACPLALCASWACAGRAGAQETLDEIAGADDKAGKTENVKTVEANGYVDNRFQYSLVNPTTTPAPTQDFPSIQDLLEANVQLKVNLGAHAFAYGDLSLFLQDGWLFYTRDPATGDRVRADDHDVPGLRPSVVTSELYLSWSPAAWLNLLAGKKRIVWGSGFAFNPTDLVNPPKDPTDPNLQRAGSWLARVEVPFEKLTLSAVFAPSVLYQQSGLPYRFMRYPGYPPAESLAPIRAGDPRDTDNHFLVAVRLYALIASTDINLIYSFSNLYQDGYTNKSRVGVSFSRYFFTDYELHVEALLQSGSGRAFANHDCVSGGPCPDPVHTALAPSKLDDPQLYPRVLVGGRTMFKDESLLSIEYYYQGDGDTDDEFADRVRGLLLARTLVESGALSTTTVNTGALPQRFAFDPLRRHYLILSYTRPRIHDDWTASIVAIAGLRDLSGMISPSVTWNVREWLNLSLFGFVPIRGIPVGQATVAGRSYSEYSLAPFDFRVMFEARAYY